jgi:endonuclease G, mitochondrial
LHFLRNIISALFFFWLLATISANAQNPTQHKIADVESKIASLKTAEDSLRAVLESLKLEEVRNQILKIGLPYVEKDEELILHSAMALVYSEPHEQAKWVAHIITPDVASGNIGRTNDFRPDPKVSTGSAVEADYFLKHQRADGTYRYDGFGFDRGHLAPSADFRWSATALSESYYYSNMSPQVADFNRISWAKLENLFRNYVDSYNTPLYVVTGPVLHDKLPKVPRSVNQVSIPELYFKVAIDLENNRGIGFIMPNKLCENPTETYAVTIDSVENITGINFFYKLPNDIQSVVESQCNPLDWLSAKEKGDALPLDSRLLPKNHFNTIESKLFVGKQQRVSICGTVVSSRLSAKGNIFLNLDKGFPNQVFTVTIFKSNTNNFSYQPHTVLKGRQICVTGRISEFNGVPSMVIENEKSITIIDEDY